MAAWHRELILAENPDARVFNIWQGYNLPDYHTCVSGKPFTIRQLKEAYELVFEGRSQHHCVSTYIRQCYYGQTSIWSLQSIMDSGNASLLTIQLTGNKIVQAKGACNRRPNNQERAIMCDWAKKNQFILNYN